MDYYTDAIYIKVIKYMNNGEDFAKRVTEPFMLGGILTRHASHPDDPITKNTLSVQLDSQDENNLSMRVHTLYGTKTGAFFHREVKQTRKSNILIHANGQISKAYFYPSISLQHLVLALILYRFSF